MLETDPDSWLAIVFIFLMGFSILIYAVLDGYDLGVGILLRFGSPEEKDRMIASIGPFWDANETWLVMGVGLLLVAFPFAHGLILTELYIPTALLLAGLILRGVSFDFRAKVHTDHKKRWDSAFNLGSLLATLAQGYMLGRYIVGFDDSLGATIFALLSAVCVSAAYSMIGASWLIMKTEGELQKRAIHWAKYSLVLTAIGLAVVSIVNPLISDRIYSKWFTLPNIIVLAPIPLISVALLIALYKFLNYLPRKNDAWCWVPFVGTLCIFILSFQGLVYSFYPYVVPDQLTIWEAAAAPESLKVLLIGVAIVFPTILIYTVYAYRVFWGKASDLNYD